jgi:hypothetical protein
LAPKHRWRYKRDVHGMQWPIHCSCGFVAYNLQEAENHFRTDVRRDLKQDNLAAVVVAVLILLAVLAIFVFHIFGP